MIPQSTIDQILEAARIEEVVGDYVSLKKRGTNLIGLCPFHDEKTPSFNVSPTKGIYKCFGCGKAGTSVNFLMDHEHLSFPEAVRFLGKKYGIEVAEEEQTDEQKEADRTRESLYIVSGFAQRFFTETLHETDEGKAIGLTYLRQRGVSPDMMERFLIGFAPDKWDGLLKAATDQGYNPEFLDQTGLTLSGEDGRRHDRFRGRVMFPIRNLSGRVIGFGGRTLRTDKKTAKYINSPESEIYHKSNVLYGLFEARKAIVDEDSCYLVEGYTDVISLHQAGVENVVASSGTSLTEGQIRLIRRYTPNIVILYDGDAAGIKASFRGLDLILQEGMNVKVVLFPDGEDPDSFSKKHPGDEVRTFIRDNSKDFISFKTGLLWEEAKGDPIKKAGLIKDIVRTIALIPDAIVRSVYVKECAGILDVEEQALVSELNKLRRDKGRQKYKRSEEAPWPEEDEYTERTPDNRVHSLEPPVQDTGMYQERELIRLLLQYGGNEILIEKSTEEEQPADNKPEMVPMTVANFMIGELQADGISLRHEGYGRIFDEICRLVSDGEVPDEKQFFRHADPTVSATAIDLLSSRYVLSENWEKRGINVETEEMVLKKSVYKVIYSLKQNHVMDMIHQNQEKLKQDLSDAELAEVMSMQNLLNLAKVQIASQLERVILK
ncbi:MAG: DNA primase [Flavobacteriales bacterium]|nr:DNA primase [Flavobacteriales bacterium]MCB9446771.1 DNA primase [Flavobacteriales bacterium]